MVYNWSKWAEEFGIDGYYIDNSMIVIHITNCMVLSWVGPADLTYDGATLTVPVECHNYRLLIVEKK